MTKIPQRLLGEALQFTEQNFPQKTAIIQRTKEFSYSLLKDSSENLASYLISAGIRKGDRVAVFMNNSFECAVSIYGASFAGAVFLVINPQTKADKLNYILKDSEARILITELSYVNEISKGLENNLGLEKVLVSGELSKITWLPDYQLVEFNTVIKSKFKDVVFPRIIPNDLAALIYTSGSTGFPKGVMMTHQSMVFASWSLIEYLRLKESDRILLLLPLAFDYGLYQLLMSVSIGGTLIMEQSFTFQTTIYNIMDQLKPTVFPGIPMIYAMMIATHKKNGKTFDYIEKITNTAAALPANFIPDLKKIFPNALVFKMYGLTECKRVCYLEPELVDLKPASVGKAIPGTEVFLLSPEGNPVGPDERGILHIRGPHIMAGYWKKEEQTNEMLVPGKLPGERFLNSHDWFSMDNEGFLYFLGRSDDIIKTRGEKVSPIEVENVIYSINGIKEAAVIGQPDEVMGESIFAYVTLHDNSGLEAKDIVKECFAKLESFMVPKHVIIIREMPKNSNGKIDKAELKTRSFNE